MLRIHKAESAAQAPHRPRRSSAPVSSEGSKSCNANAAASASSIPPSAPSQLFPGLMEGASLCLPNRLPAIYAPLSAAHTNNRIENANRGLNVRASSNAYPLTIRINGPAASNNRRHRREYLVLGRKMRAKGAMPSQKTVAVRYRGCVALCPEWRNKKKRRPKPNEKLTQYLFFNASSRAHSHAAHPMIAAINRQNATGRAKKSAGINTANSAPPVIRRVLNI